MHNSGGGVRQCPAQQQTFRHTCAVPCRAAAPAATMGLPAPYLKGAPRLVHALIIAWGGSVVGEVGPVQAGGQGAGHGMKGAP